MNSKLSPVWRRLALAAAIAAIHAVPAWAATPADTVVIAKNLDDFLSIDPAESAEFASAEITNNLYTRVLSFSTDDFSKVIGGAADRWEFSADDKTLTLHVRPGQTFSSGRPLTANDVVFSLQRVVRLKTRQSDRFAQFGWTPDSIDTLVTAKGDTVVLRFPQALARSLVLNVLASGPAAVIDAQEALAHQQGSDLGNAWLRTSAAGSGAYTLSSLRPKEAVALEANTRFYLGAPAVKRVIIRHIAEVATQRLLLEKGDVDIARNLSADQVNALASNHDVYVQTEDREIQIYLALNQQTPALAKPEVRQALRWLVDYDAISSQLLGGRLKVNQTPLPTTLGSNGLKPYRFDLAKGRALLEKAGYAQGFSVSFDVPTFYPYPEIAQAVQNSFAKAGVRVELTKFDTKQVLTRHRNGQHQLGVYASVPAYSDPDPVASFFVVNPDPAPNAPNKNGAQRQGWVPPAALSALAVQARQEPDAAKRAKIYDQLQREVQKDSPYVFLLQDSETSVIRRNVTGFKTGPSIFTPVYYRLKKSAR